MNWNNSLGFLLLGLFACTQERTHKINDQIATEVAVESSYLIEVKELQTLIGHPHIKILDFRKKEYYNKGHIEGALHIWRTDVEDSDYPYGGMMASPSQIETLFGNLGIQTEDTVIIYDDNGLCDSARLWWLLQNYDFSNVKLLHGGIEAWKEYDGVISTILPSVEQTEFKLTKTPSLKYHISKDEMQQALKIGTAVLDTRNRDEYSGKRQKIGAAKGGRIPKSINIDWVEAIDYDGDKKFRSLQELSSIYSQLNIEKNEPIIVYCHSGVRSAHTTFVLTQLLDYKNVKNFDGSWIEWSYFDGLDVEKDSITTISN